jgi:flagellar motor component MotA
MTPSIDKKRIGIILGKILILVFLGLAVIFSGKFTGFMNAPGLAFVILGGLAMTLMSFSFPEVGAAFKHAAGGPDGRGELQKSVHFWESAARNVLMVGVLGTLTSFIIGLCTFQGGISSIFSVLAAAFLTTLYGVILGVVCLVPALKVTKELHKQPPVETQEVRLKPQTLKYENIIGYVLFISLIGWTILTATSAEVSIELTPLKMFIHWPSLLVVVGGTVALVLFAGDARGGRSLTLSFAFTGLIGVLMGFVQVLHSLSSRSIKDVASASSFIISSCFIALVGMMLLGIPLEDRSLKARKNYKDLALSRIAWYVFPLLTLIFLFFVFILVVTPIKKVNG